MPDSLKTLPPGLLIAGLFFALLILLVACGGGGGSDDQAPPAPSLEIYGDSIPFGPGIERNVAAQIRALRPEWTVMDYSAGGVDLRDVLHGYQEPYPGASPDVYPQGPQPAFAVKAKASRYQVIALGGNDALGMQQPASFEAGLRELIGIARAEGRVPILTGIVNAPTGEFFTQAVLERRGELNAITLSLAAELGLQHAGWGEDYRGEVDVIHDRIHRTQVASDRLAALLVAAVERAAQEELER